MLLSKVVLVLALTMGPIVMGGRPHCFRRVRKRSGLCGGLIRHIHFSDAHHCCRRRGQGFADTKVRLGRNRFECTPCSSLLQELPASSSTSSSSKSSLSSRSFRRGSRSGGIRPPPPPSSSSSSSSSAAAATTAPTLTTTSKRSPSSSYRVSSTTDWSTSRRRGYVMHNYLRPADGSDVVVWQEWSPCSVTCGAGWRSRARVCDDCDHNDYENVRIELCMDKFYCPLDGNWGPWQSWGTCSTSCDQGIRTRARKCNYPPPAYGGAYCPGDGLQRKECQLSSCPVDGAWGAWSELSTCSTTCGPGQVVRTRLCDSPEPRLGGRDCPGPDRETEQCQVAQCPVDGGWSRWSVWGDCSVTCGHGTREQIRSCDNPAPRHGGRDCQGETRMLQDCHAGRQCPVDGGWSPWSAFSRCRARPCSRGFRIRSRRCTSPRPAHGGRGCRGNRYERITCFYDTGCPQNGNWCPWSEWNSCSSSCGEMTSVRGRQRHCACPPPDGGGLECEGDSLQIEECKGIPLCSSPDEPDVTTSSKNSTDHQESVGENLATTNRPEPQGPESSSSSSSQESEHTRVIYRTQPSEEQDMEINNETGVWIHVDNIGDDKDTKDERP